MNTKRVLYFLTGFVSIILVCLFTLSFLQTNYRIDLPNPDVIKIYNRSQVATKSYSSSANEYQSIINMYNHMSEKTYLMQIIDNKILTVNAEQLIAEPFVEATKETGIFVEFIFNTAKKMVIYENSNSRQVDVSAIIFTPSSEKGYNLLKVYYRTGASYIATDDYGEEIYPLGVEAETKNIYDYVTNIL